jgi:hypothetical protein
MRPPDKNGLMNDIPPDRHPGTCGAIFLSGLNRLFACVPVIPGGDFFCSFGSGILPQRHGCRVTDHGQAVTEQLREQRTEQIDIGSRPRLLCLLVRPGKISGLQRAVNGKRPTAFVPAAVTMIAGQDDDGITLRVCLQALEEFNDP